MLIRSLAGGLVAAVLTVIFTSLLIRALRNHAMMDVPNERSSHTLPTPRGGGVGIILGALCGIGLQSCIWDLPLPDPAFSLALAGIALTGLIDDAIGLSASLRLALQSVFAAILLGSGCALAYIPAPRPLDLPLNEWVGWLLSWLWLVGVTNIYNFLDGIDGFAAFQGLVACAALSVAPLPQSSVAVTAAAAGGCLGFLYHNWHPAKIFMGDVGSTTLGFLIAATPLQAPVQLRSSALFMTGLAVWFFLSDGTYTLLRRALRGERLWQAHRTHLYQQYAAAGFRHDHVVTRVGSAAAAVAALAAIAFFTRQPIFMWAVLSIAVLSFAVYREKVAKLYRLPDSSSF